MHKLISSDPAANDRPRLVFVNRFYAPDMSATSQILTDIAEMMAASGYSVTIYTSRMSYDGRKRFCQRETIKDVDVRRIWTTRFGRNSTLGRAIDYLTFHLSATLILALRITRSDLLIVKTDPPMLSVPIGFVTRIKRIKSTNWLQDVFPEVAGELSGQTKKKPVMRLLTFMRNRSLRRAVANICIGSIMAEKVKSFGIPPSRIHVIENFVDDDAIRPQPGHSPQLRSAWGISQDDFVVAYSGNLGRAHDLDTILGAARCLRHEPHIKFLFIGGGYLRDRLAIEIEKGDLSSVLLRPYQPREKLSESLGLANVHWVSLNPKLEGLIVPSKAYGVAAAGRPLLMIGDVDGEIGSNLEQYDFGASFAPGDVEAVSDCILQLSQSPDRLTAMQESARAFIDQKASKRLAFAKWRALIEHLTHLD